MSPDDEELQQLAGCTVDGADSSTMIGSGTGGVAADGGGGDSDNDTHSSSVQDEGDSTASAGGRGGARMGCSTADPDNEELRPDQVYWWVSIV